MTVAELAERLGLEVQGWRQGLGREVTGGYASDLLSCALAGAAAGDVWVTLQAHQNVVAVASLVDVACVVITEGARPDADTLAKAERERVVILLTPDDSFATIAGLARLGVEA
jgi:hypothetical protein